jgi:hypothetical protein
MKRALIDSGNNRVVQVVDMGGDFEVHSNLYWVDCPDQAESYFIYDPENLTFEDPHASSKDDFGNPVEPWSMQRQRAYPGFGEQLDMLWKEIRDTGSISKDGQWFKNVQLVKDSIPRPNNYSLADPVITTDMQWFTADGKFVQLFTDAGGTGGSGTGAVFKIRKADTVYQVATTAAGTNYTVGDVITLSGEGYNCAIEVTAVATNGSIVAIVIK